MSKAQFLWKVKWFSGGGAEDADGYQFFAILAKKVRVILGFR
jgi:hypothetical protein